MTKAPYPNTFTSLFGSSFNIYFYSIKGEEPETFNYVIGEVNIVI